jgi:hypothetical protein
MNAVYSLFADPGSAQRAVDRLRAAGVADHDITVISSEPFEGYPFSQRDKATWLFWIAPAGGLLGLAFGVWLTTMIQRAWPIMTGGMPIVAWWPNLIIMFELTMLGGILATVITLVISAKLPFGASTIYDPAVADGKILVGVEKPAESVRGDIERALRA